MEFSKNPQQIRTISLKYIEISEFYRFLQYLLQNDSKCQCMCTQPRCASTGPRPSPGPSPGLRTAPMAKCSHYASREIQSLQSYQSWKAWSLLWWFSDDLLLSYDVIIIIMKIWWLWKMSADFSGLFFSGLHLCWFIAFSFFAGRWKKMEQLSVRRCTSVCTSTCDIHLDSLRQSLRETVAFCARNAGLSIQTAILPIYFSVCLPVCLAGCLCVCLSVVLVLVPVLFCLSSICGLYIYIYQNMSYILFESSCKDRTRASSHTFGFVQNGGYRIVLSSWGNDGKWWNMMENDYQPWGRHQGTHIAHDFWGYPYFQTRPAMHSQGTVSKAISTDLRFLHRPACVFAGLASREDAFCNCHWLIKKTRWFRQE